MESKEVTHIREQISVERSAGLTERRLERYLASLRGTDGIARLRLRVPIDTIAAPLGLSIGREVRVEARRARDDDNLNDLIRVAWGPEGKAPFPTFDGTLVVWGEPQKELSYIELDGNYTPPLGAAGQVFDEIIGRSIAESTMREFLKDLKRAIED